MTTGLGYYKGLTRQFFGLGGVVAGYIVSVKFYEPVAHLLTESDSALIRLISFITLFVISKSAVSSGGWIARRLYKSSGFSRANRVGGALLGLLKGMLIIMIITLTLLAFMPDDSNILTGSSTLPYLVSLPRISSGIAPEKLRNRYNRTREKLKERWEKSPLNTDTSGSQER